MPRGRQAFAITRVISISSLLGEGSPLGWLCTTPARPHLQRPRTPPADQRRWGGWINAASSPINDALPAVKQGPLKCGVLMRAQGDGTGGHNRSRRRLAKPKRNQPLRFRVDERPQILELGEQFFGNRLHIAPGNGGEKKQLQQLIILQRIRPRTKQPLAQTVAMAEIVGFLFLRFGEGEGGMATIISSCSLNSSLAGISSCQGSGTIFLRKKICPHQPP